MEKKYKLEDLKLGMRVKSKELSDILNTYVALGKVEYTDMGLDVEGDIIFIGKTLDNEYEASKKYGGTISIIFNDSLEREGDIEYDE